MNKYVETIRDPSLFKNDNEFYEYLRSTLASYDLIDLLEKLSCLRFFIKTDCLKIEENEEVDRRYLVSIFNNGLCFLFPFLLSYKVEDGNKKIDYYNLLVVCKIIFNYSNYRNNKVDENEEENIEKIEYVQNNMTDLFFTLKRVPIGDVLKYESDLIEERYDVNSEQLLEELIDIFPRKIFIPFNKNKSVSIIDFVNHFDSFIDVSNFVILPSYKSYNICNDLSVEFGELTQKQFNISNPLGTINLSRKLFIKNNGNIYNICDDLICGRLNRSIESLFKSDEERKKWAENYKNGNEELIMHLFNDYFPNGKYYKNYYYKDNNNHLCEGDGVFFFHSFIFCVEVKGNKFNPDSVKENCQEVKESYESTINKAEEQVLRIKEKLNEKESFNILDAHGNVVERILEIESKNVIGICVYFEDIGTLLAGINNKSIIHISFYDLIIIFRYLNNPFLITKYLFERSLLSLNNKQFYINDELIYLSIFNTCIHLNSYLQNLTEPYNLDNLMIFFDFSDFSLKVENHFRKNKTKPQININDLIMRIISSSDYNAIDDNLFAGLFYLLLKPYENWSLLEKRYREKNKSNIRLPMFIIFSHKNEKFAVMLISRAHNPYQEKQSLAYVKRYFKYRANINCLYIVSIGKDYSDYKKIERNDKMLLEFDENELLSGVNYTIAQSELFNVEEN